jgi:predicted RND superfamily exporter protein
VHIIGFAKAIGDIRDGARGVAPLRAAFVITMVLMLWFVKDVKLTLVALVVAMMPVLWLLGTLPILGYGIDPLSSGAVLIFSIGVSHAADDEILEREVVGADSLAARRVREAFHPWELALLTNVLGFAVIMLIPIDIVRELGITASLGVGWMILTNKMMLPIMLSHLTLSKGVVEREASQEKRAHRIWQAAAGCVQPARARLIILVSLAILAFGAYQAHNLKVGDYGIGVPELRPDSRYNKDNAKIIEKFAVGVNTLGVVAQTRGVQGACTKYEIMSAIEDFDWYMQNVQGLSRSSRWRA